MDPLIDVVGIGPEKSLCIRWSVEAALFSFPTSYLFYGCLPIKKLRHAPSDVWMRGKTLTILSLWSCWRYLKLRFPNISCYYLLVLLARVNKVVGCKVGKKWENSYAFEAWLENPFAMKFPVDFSVISTKSELNVTLLGEPAWVIW